MIKGYNNSSLESLNVDSKYYLFCQVWKELTESKTFDSYQFKSFNIVNGLGELKHNLTNYLDNVVPTTHLITSVIEELIKTIKRDYVLANRFPDIKNQLLVNLGKKCDTVSKIKALRYQISLYEKQLCDTYDEELISCLIDAIENSKQSVVANLTSTFISRCVDQGWSPKSLYTKLDLTNGKKVDDFLNKIFNMPEQSYAIIFPFRLKITISGKTREENKEYLIEQLGKYDICLLEKDKLILEYPQVDKSLLTSSEYMIVNCTAKDVNSASHAGIIKLSNVLNILSFFSAIEPWSINNISWVVYNIDCPYSKTMSPSDIYGTYEYLDSSSTVHGRIESIITATTADNELHQKLISSFSYANLSHASMTVEEKYMNMWIALESLARSDAYDNIIGNILQCVPKACCLRYLYRNLRNFLEDCGRCGISLDFETIKIDLKKPDKEIMVSNLLEIIRQEDLCRLLIDRCSVNDLLLYRCNEIIGIVLNERDMISHIKSHYKTIEWHLNRLYRIRNEIAHSALLQNVYVVRYTEHLYDYLATYISEIVRFATVRDNVSFGEISVMINDNYNEFVFISDEKNIKDKKMAFKRLWLSGVMEFV